MLPLLLIYYTFAQTQAALIKHGFYWMSISIYPLQRIESPLPRPRATR